MKPAYIVAIVVLVGSLVATLVSFSGAIAQHVTVPQAIARPGQTVQVPGDIVKDSVVYHATKGELQFDILDRVDHRSRLTVVYNQSKPENFDTAVSVEAIGEYQDGVFRAHNLLVKCPSKYTDEKGKGRSQAGARS
jgi:cytochrome c-type biogenesis protein CcmE